MDPIKGEILTFNKPYGWTSFGLVAKVRWLLTQKLNGQKLKVGHAGTLDPLATGVMIICTGRATKRIERCRTRVTTFRRRNQTSATHILSLQN